MIHPSAARLLLAVLIAFATARAPVRAQEPVRADRTPGEVLAAATDAEWRTPDPSNLLLLDVAGGTVIIELAPRFAPRHVENLRTLVRRGWFDGGAVVRSQDNYVAQWGVRAPVRDEALPSIVTDGLPAEFEVPLARLPLDRMPDPDVYADGVGFVDGFPVAVDEDEGRAWIAHCYGTVGTARGNPADSGNGSELYAVTGHSPRHLDRSISMVGRVLAGMELLSTLPRGTGSLGFYETPEEAAVITGARIAADLRPADRPALQVLRTDSDTFRELLDARRNRAEPFFVKTAGVVSLCNAALPVRPG